MSVSMAKTIKEERLRWVLPIVKQEVKLKDVAKVCLRGKRGIIQLFGTWNWYTTALLERNSYTNDYVIKKNGRNVPFASP